MITRLEEENVELSSTKEQLWKYVRELEQKNDDLERGKRCGHVPVVLLSNSSHPQSHNVFTGRF